MTISERGDAQEAVELHIYRGKVYSVISKITFNRGQKPINYAYLYEPYLDLTVSNHLMDEEIN